MSKDFQPKRLTGPKRGIAFIGNAIKSLAKPITQPVTRGGQGLIGGAKKSGVAGAVIGLAGGVTVGALEGGVGTLKSTVKGVRNFTGRKTPEDKLVYSAIKPLVEIFKNILQNDVNPLASHSSDIEKIDRKISRHGVSDITKLGLSKKNQKDFEKYMRENLGYIAARLSHSKTDLEGPEQYLSTKLGLDTTQSAQEEVDISVPPKEANIPISSKKDVDISVPPEKENNPPREEKTIKFIFPKVYESLLKSADNDASVINDHSEILLQGIRFTNLIGTMPGNGAGSNLDQFADNMLDKAKQGEIELQPKGSKYSPDNCFNIILALRNIQANNKSEYGIPDFQFPKSVLPAIKKAVLSTLYLHIDGGGSNRRLGDTDEMHKKSLQRIKKIRNWAEN